MKSKKIKTMQDPIKLKNKLISTALEWGTRYGVAPAITSALSEYDAALLIGMKEKDFSEFMQFRNAVAKGYDFEFKGERYQIKANRPSGKPGSKVTRVAKVNNFEWDKLIWVLYDDKYEIEEAWLWDKAAFKKQLDPKNLKPNDLRKGKNLLSKSS